MKNNIEWNKITKLIKKYKQIIILRHENPDGDALGSQWALKEFIDINFENKKVFCLGNDEENNEKNPLSFFPKNEILKEVENSLVFILDTSTSLRIANKNINFKLNNYFLNLDHHPFLGKFTDDVISSTDFSSTCELLGTYFFSNSKFKINKKIAEYLYFGMVTDTNRFLFSSVSANTFNVLENLANASNSLQKIAESLTYRSFNLIKLQNKIFQKAKYKGNFAYSIIKNDIWSKLDLNFSDASSQVNVLMQPKEVNFAFFAIYNKENKCFKISLRCKEGAVNKFAEAFGGGGHQKACGLKAQNLKQLKHILKEFLKLNVTV